MDYYKDILKRAILLHTVFDDLQLKCLAIIEIILL